MFHLYSVATHYVHPYQTIIFGWFFSNYCLLLWTSKWMIAATEIGMELLLILISLLWIVTINHKINKTLKPKSHSICCQIDYFWGNNWKIAEIFWTYIKQLRSCNAFSTYFFSSFKELAIIKRDRTMPPPEEFFKNWTKIIIPNTSL